MFNGHQSIQQFSLQLTVMVMLIFGISIETLRVQLPGRKLLKHQTPELTKISMTPKLCLALNGQEMVEE
jgi:hypothetical protein